MNLRVQPGIGDLLHDVSRLRRAVLDQRMRHLNITSSQWFVLCGLLRHGAQGITQAELADALGIGKIALGGILDRLEKRGFVERHPQPNDRRANRILLSPSGTSNVELMTRISTELSSRIFKGISRQSQNLLSDALQKMQENIQELNADCMKSPGVSLNGERRKSDLDSGVSIEKFATTLL